MRQIAAVLFLVILTIPVLADDTYTPLTDEEALKYINTAPIENLVDDIQKLDAIEWSYPEITIPKAAGVYTAESLTVTYTGPWKIEVGGHLAYEITVDPLTFEIPKTPFPWRTVGITAGASFAAGAILMLILAR